MENRVVGRFLDGRVIRGVCFDFSPAKPICHIQTQSEGNVEVGLGELKALFFVKDLQGNPEHRETRALDPADPRRLGARPVEVRFRDGETLVGLVTGYSAERPFFFLLPADPRSNNTRILVNRAAVESVKPMPATPSP